MIALRLLVVSTAVACNGTTTKAPHTTVDLPLSALSTDADGDGIADAEDACPQEPGAPSTNPFKRGCPQRASVVTAGDAFVVHVYFPRAASTLLPETFPLIDATIVVLRSKPEVRHVIVEGYASPDEPEAQRLSEARAKAVLDRMVAAGIDRERLVPCGRGSSRPTSIERTQNRRVEFHILDESSSCSSSVQSAKP